MTGGFQTERLALRQVEPGDVDLLVDLNGDVDVMEFITARPNSLDETAADLEASLGTRWPALARADGQFLGWVSAVPGREGEQFEIGWRFKLSAWGNGYATEAGRALVDLAFTRGARRVYAQTMAVNIRSRAVMELLGLRYHTTFHLAFDDPLPGTEQGEVEYEILRSEWMKRRRSTCATRQPGVHCIRRHRAATADRALVPGEVDRVDRRDIPHRTRGAERQPNPPVDPSRSHGCCWCRCPGGRCAPEHMGGRWFVGWRCGREP